MHCRSRPSRPESFAVGSTRSTATFTRAVCSPGPAIGPNLVVSIGCATGKPIVVPIAIRARHDGLAITFTEPLDRSKAGLTSHYTAKTWSIKRTINYGSKHDDEHAVRITSATLFGDGRTVVLEIPNLRPTRCMEVTYDLQTQNGEPAQGVIHNTIHQLGE